MAIYSKLNEFGFIETPYKVVKDGKVQQNEFRYLSADEEDGYVIAQANSKLDKEGGFVNPLVSCRSKDDFPLKPPSEIDFIDVSPVQVVSVSTSLIPFLEHDDANRALMGSNMQRQSVPLLKPEIPLVGTGMESKISYDSGVSVLAEHEGIVTKVDASMIQVTDSNKNVHTYNLHVFRRSNQKTTIHHTPCVQIFYAPADGVVEKLDKECYDNC